MNSSPANRLAPVIHGFSWGMEHPPVEVTSPRDVSTGQVRLARDFATGRSSG